MTPQNPEELSVWLAVFKSRVRDGLLFESAEDEANAALAEHRDRVGWPSSVASVNEAQPAQSFDSWLATDAEPQKLIRSVVNHISASIDYALRRDSELSSDPSLAWLAEVMRHAPPSEHAAPYCAFMRTVEGLAARSDEAKAVKVALADVQREYDELVREHAAAMDVEQAKRQVERGETLRELGKLHELLAAASGYVTDVFHLSADPEQRARVRKLLHEIGKVISPTLIALPNDGE